MSGFRRSDSHDDIQGILGTALSGVTQWTPTQFRSTGVVFNEIASGDIFSMVYQFSHRRKLQSQLDDVHMHFIPMGAQNGNIAFTFAWGWYNHETVVDNTLPNTGTVADISLLTTDQYKLKIKTLISNLTPPPTEGYSSILLTKFVAVAPASGTNWWTAGGTNRIALVYLDSHGIVDRCGSILTATDV